MTIPTYRDDELEKRCSWCGRFLREGAWVDGEPTPGFVITHGMCPECRVALEAELANAGVGDDPEDPVER